MIISIASGKGGTGKTTIATNLATVLGPRAQLLDCDVEQPNAHLFIQPDFFRSEPVHTPVPEVDPDRCTGCGECEAICQFKAIVVVGGKIMTFPELCHSCGGCFAVCPEDAITETGRELGTIEAGTRDGLLLVYGRSRVGEAMSPPLIRRVRAEGEPDRITIIDAPPGTSCPVIAAMKGADFVLLVTEPTPFGLNDLELAAGAVKVLGIPAGLAINRSDIGDDRVKDYATSVGLPVLLELPFDRRVAEAYSRGELLVTAIDGMKERFEGLYADIEAIVARRRAS
jgi:MinD superfamily P-loop ATPase